MVSRRALQALAAAFVGRLGGLLSLWLAAGTALGAPYASPWLYGQPYPGPPIYVPGQSRPASPASRPEYRPIPSTNAEGVPPSFQPPVQGRTLYGAPGYPPNWQPSHGASPFQQVAPAAPRLEWSLEERRPYLQQPLILRLDVISADNLSALDLQLPPSGDVMLQRLRGPDTSPRSTGGKREIVNRFLLSLVPLRAGVLDVPAIKVAGTQGGAGFGQRFTAVTPDPLRIEVRPPMHSVRPWLPLKSLGLKASVDRESGLDPGQPVTLTLEMSADGATAAQLPNLESQLIGSGFRVYREQTDTDTHLSTDGRWLLARRTEYYTLVPQVGGRLALPEISVVWWNVDRDEREIARLPIKTLNVRAAGPFGLASAALLGSDSVRILVPLTGLLLLIAGYWAGVLYRGRPMRFGQAALTAAVRGSRHGLLVISRRSRRLLRPLQPSLLLAAARRTWLGSLSAERRLLRGVRRANLASDPRDWYRSLDQEFKDSQPLPGGSAQVSLTRQLLLRQPAPRDGEMRRLLGQLDGALYGRRPLDFSRWKQDFLSQLRHGAAFRRQGWLERVFRRAALPALNPN